MHKSWIVVLATLTLGGLWSCEVSETDPNTATEDAIMRLIAADDSTYAIDGLEDVSDDGYSLDKTSDLSEADMMAMTEVLIDSNYIWRFGRSDMNSEREVTIEVDNDSAAVALISYHITGIFHARQFERTWTTDSTWLIGDSVQFSEKAIDMLVDRRVAFRKRSLIDGEEHWIATAMTLAYGSSGDVLGIQSLDWVAEDSIRVLDKFETTFYDRGEPLTFAMMGLNQLKVVVSNEAAGEAEAVIGRFGFNPRLSGPDLRNRIPFQYVETLDSGDKVYTRLIPPVYRPLRHFKGFVEVLDFRTLFDHDYMTYSAATVGFVYMMRQHVRP